MLTRSWLEEPASLGSLSNHLEAENAVPLPQKVHGQRLPRRSKAAAGSSDGKVDHSRQLPIAAIGLLTPVEFGGSVLDGFRKAGVDGSVEDARFYLANWATLAPPRPAGAIMQVDKLLRTCYWVCRGR